MLEVLVVVAIFGIVGSLGLYATMNSYHGSNFRNDRNLLIATLQRARAQSINNICLGTCPDGRKHGVKILTPTPPATPSYVIFQTTNGYDSGRDAAYDVIFQAAPTTARSGDDEVVFEQLTGNAGATTITLTGGGRTSVITIESLGSISWTDQII